ncbi:MAG: toprim domain-containing protein [Planctomycetota bacterium]|nr:toprim domain-containing protein [Planctomycetota bacterium]
MTRNVWKRVRKGNPCKVCGKDTWCSYTGPDDSPTAVICARMESPIRIGAAGWLHRLRDDDWKPVQTIRRAVRMVEASGANLIDFAKLAADCCARVHFPDLQRLAVCLGLSVESLRRLRVGWSKEHHAWTFPMCNVGGAVLGIRLRLLTGKKLSVRGGHEGLFMPDGLDAGGRLAVCEGPTDTAAMLDLGQAAVGRPSCTGGVKLLVELVKQRRPSEVIIVADGDAPGQRGAESLSAVLVAYCPAVRVITPPVGMKDARAWLQRGATPQDLAAVIDAAPVRRLAVRSKAGRAKR